MTDTELVAEWCSRALARLEHQDQRSRRDEIRDEIRLDTTRNRERHLIIDGNDIVPPTKIGFIWGLPGLSLNRCFGPSSVNVQSTPPRPKWVAESNRASHGSSGEDGCRDALCVCPR